MAKPSKTPRHFCFLATVTAYGTLAIAGVPHEFKTGDKASAQQVMDNFHYIDSMSTVLKAELQKAQAALIDQGIDLKSVKAKVDAKPDSSNFKALQNAISAKLDTTAGSTFIHHIEPKGFSIQSPSAMASMTWTPSSTGGSYILGSTAQGYESVNGIIGFGDHFYGGPGFFMGDERDAFGLFSSSNGYCIGLRGRSQSEALITDGSKVTFPNSVTFEGTVAMQQPASVVDLSVSGILTVQSKQIAPDYVFEPNYPLMPLPDVARFVQTNKHLPEIPDAAHIASQGMDVGTMNLLLLKKVEELTLHLIDQNRRIDSLQAAMQTH